MFYAFQSKENHFFLLLLQKTLIYQISGDWLNNAIYSRRRIDWDLKWLKGNSIKLRVFCVVEGFFSSTGMKFNQPREREEEKKCLKNYITLFDTELNFAPSLIIQMRFSDFEYNE